jgi:beta-1,3-glucuronyltransferase P
MATDVLRPAWKAASSHSTALIVVTPTHATPRRLAFLRRCVGWFAGVPDLFWIVVEDGDALDPEVHALLTASGIDFEYLHIGPTRAWGNAQRDLALRYIRDRRLDGVVYFADDDNGYDPALFAELRKTRYASVFPVGLLGPRGVERPVLRDGTIVGWESSWMNRRFPVDHAGFAFRSFLLFDQPDPIVEYTGRGGESELLEKLVRDPSRLEVLCDGATKCYAFHNQPLGDSLAVTRLRIALFRLVPAGFRRRVRRLLLGD